MHFFIRAQDEAARNRARLETDADTLAAVVEVGKRMRKEVVVIKEAPGFITAASTP